MEIVSRYILHVETVDKREVALQSQNMEKEGFVMSLQFLLTKLSCKEIIMMLQVQYAMNLMSTHQ